MNGGSPTRSVQRRYLASHIVAMSTLLALCAGRAFSEPVIAKSESEANKGIVVNSGPAGPFEQSDIRRGAIANAPTSRGASAAPSTSRWDIAKVPAALGAVILLIFVLRWAGKGMLPGGAANKGSQAIQLVARTAIGPKHQVMLIHVGRRLVVIGAAGGGEISSLSEITEPDEVAEVLAQIKAGSGIVKNFKAVFGKAGSAYDNQSSVASDEPDPEAAPPKGGPELAGLMDRVRRMAEKFQGT